MLPFLSVTKRRSKNGHEKKERKCVRRMDPYARLSPRSMIAKMDFFTLFFECFSRVRASNFFHISSEDMFRFVTFFARRFSAQFHSLGSLPVANKF